MKMLIFGIPIWKLIIIAGGAFYFGFFMAALLAAAARTPRPLIRTTSVPIAKLRREP